MPAGYVPEIAADFVKQPQAVEETAPGVPVLTSPSFFQLGHINKFNITNDVENKKFRVIGSEDLLTAVKTGEAYAIQYEGFMFNTQFAKYLTNSRGGGAGSIDKSLMIAWSATEPAGETWQYATMVRPNTGTITVTPEMVSLSMTLIAANISVPVTTDPFTTPTYITPSAVDPFVGASGGPNPFVHNALSYDVPTFTTDITRNLHAIRVNGALQIIDNPSTNRDISGTFDVIRKNNVLRADTKDLTKRAATYSLNAAPAIGLSFTDMQLESLGETYDGESNEVITDSFGYYAKALALTG